MMDILCLSLVQLENASVNASMASLEHTAKVCHYLFSFVGLHKLTWLLWRWLRIPFLLVHFFFAVHPCDIIPCQNGGAPMDDPAAPGVCWCECINGFTGEFCEGMQFSFLLSLHQLTWLLCRWLVWHSVRIRTFLFSGYPCEHVQCHNDGIPLEDPTVASGCRCECINDFTGEFCEGMCLFSKNSLH